jgi:uncharacterized peroxidase-related enzyme
MTWIKIIPYEKATGRLKKLYERIKGPDDKIDNIMAAHALRPHTMAGHMALYKNVLHHTANKIPTGFLETIGVYVSFLNGCDYCFLHHFEGMKRHLKNDLRAQEIKTAIERGAIDEAFTGKELAALLYAGKLTTHPGASKEDDVLHLKAIGWSDGEILEINQVTAYFAYANRMVLGLGVDTEGEILGLSPEDGDDDAWGHR